MDAGLFTIYWRTGSRFVTHTGGSALKVVHTPRLKALLLLVRHSVAKRFQPTL